MRAARLFAVGGLLACVLAAGRARAASVLILDFETLNVGAQVSSAVATGGTNSFPVAGINGSVVGTAVVVADASLQSRRALGLSTATGAHLDIDLSTAIPGVAGNGELVSLRLVG